MQDVVWIALGCAWHSTHVHDVEVLLVGRHDHILHFRDDVQCDHLPLAILVHHGEEDSQSTQEVHICHIAPLEEAPLSIDQISILIDGTDVKTVG